MNQNVAAQTVATRRVDLSTKIYYGIGAIANGAKSNGFNYLLLFYYSQVIGLRADLVSLGILIALIFDAVSDPLVGYISDNFHSPWGRRHPFMYAAGLPVAVAYYFLWSPPAWDEQGLFLYFVCMAILIRTMITFYEIPATALVAELTDDYDQRTEMMSFRYFFAWWGGLTMAILAYRVFLPEELGGTEYLEGWKNYGLTASITIFLSVYISALGTHKHIPNLRKPPAKHQFNLKGTFIELKETLANRSFLSLFAAALLMAVAFGLSAALSIYFQRHFWEFTTSEIGKMNQAYYLSAFVALFLGPYISKKLGKKRGGMTIMAATGIWLSLPYLLRMAGWFPENGTETLFWTLTVVNAIEVALFVIWSSLIASMIADIVEESELKTGRRSEGTFFAANSFASKAVNGFGVIVAGQILTIVEFPTQAKPGEVSLTILYDLAYLYIPTMLLFYIGAVFALSYYQINREDHVENLRQLSESQ